MQAIDSKCGLASNGKRHEYIKEYFTKTASEGGQSRLRKIFESTGKLIVPENSVGHKKSVCGLKEQINGFIDEEFSRMAPLKYKADCSDIDKAAKMP